MTLPKQRPPADDLAAGEHRPPPSGLDCIRPTPWDVTLIGLLWLLYALALVSSNLTVDVARDIAQAHLIATGDDWPLRGPMIGSATYLGPLWFYLLAPAAASGSVLVVALWAGVLAGSKFLFGWLLGASLAGRGGARGVVVALTLPAWNGFELLVFSHTNLVAASLLAFAWACLRLWRRPAAGWAVGAIGAGTLMLHAHPSTLPVLCLVLPGLGRGLRRKSLRLAGPLIAIAAGVALFVPPLLGPAEGDVALGVATMLPSAGALTAAPMAALELGRAILTTGPVAITALVGDWSTAGGVFLGAVAAVVVLAAIAGLLRQVGPLRMLLLVGVLLLAGWLPFLEVVRPQVPFYMAYGPSTLVTVMLGLGLGRWLGTRAGGLLAVLLAASLIGSQSAALHGLSLRGVLDVPAPLVDIASPVPGTGGPGAEQLSPLAADRLARRLCAEPQALHGPLAVAMDLAYGIALRMRCGLALSDLAALDSPEHPGVVGLPAAAWSATDRAPDESFGQWGLADVVAVTRRGRVDWADYRSSRDYPPRPWPSGDARDITIEVEIGPGEIMVVTSLAHAFGGNAPARLEADGGEIDPAWRSEWSSVWHPAPGRSSRYLLRLSGRTVDAFEVVVFRPGP